MGIQRFSRPFANNYYRYHPLYNETNVFDRDWDLLIILDALRADYLESFLSDYEYLRQAKRIDTIYSVHHWTGGWMDKTFSQAPQEETLETKYVSKSAWVTDHLDTDQVGELDAVYDYGWDDELETVPPRTITDRVVAAGRNSRFDRIIAHYNQPHQPFINKPLRTPDGQLASEMYPEADVWELLYDGKLTRSEVEKSYRSNIKYVLDELSVLLDNIDAEKVVISSDHGNAFGEWHFYGHPHSWIPQIRRVPWVVTSADDSNEFVCEIEPEREESATNVEEQLSALGYK
jgi:hypothetical protein